MVAQLARLGLLGFRIRNYMLPLSKSLATTYRCSEGCELRNSYEQDGRRHPLFLLSKSPVAQWSCLTWGQAQEHRHRSASLVYQRRLHCHQPGIDRSSLRLHQTLQIDPAHHTCCTRKFALPLTRWFTRYVKQCIAQTCSALNGPPCAFPWSNLGQQLRSSQDQKGRPRRKSARPSLLD